MKNTLFEKNIKLASDTCYFADQEQYDIYLSDTTRCEDKKYLSIRKENYGYLSVAFLIRGLKNVTLDFRGAKLVLHGRIQPFIIDHAENITIKNCSVVYDRAFFTEAEILECSKEQMRIHVSENFPCRVENGYLIPASETWENHDLNKLDMFLQAFDKTTREAAGLMVVVIGETVYRHPTPPCEVQQLKVREYGEDVILTGKIPENWRSGLIVVLTHEYGDKNNILICDSRNCAIENYRIINGASSGILAMHTENISIRHLVLRYDQESPGITTNASDVVHTIACSGELLIEDSIFEGMIDDALNVHSNYYLTEATDGCQLSAVKDGRSSFLNAHCTVIAQGDEIAVYNGLTMELKETFHVCQAAIRDDYTVDLLLDRPASRICRGDMIENLTAQARLTICNCRFGKANTNLRLQTRGTILIENCECHLPIILTGDTNFWFESSPVRDLTIRNCRFKGPRGVVRIIPEIMPTDKEPYYHQNIRILDNEFDAAVPLVANHADNLVFKQNKLTDSGQTFKLILKNCGRADTGDCEVERQG